jgi:hypothetical protein
MATQMNFGPKCSYKTAKPDSTINHSQSNFDGGRTTKKGGTNRSRGQMNFPGSSKTPHNTDPGQGQKPGTGCNHGY